jgi:hypothetical protein
MTVDYFYNSKIEKFGSYFRIKSVAFARGLGFDTTPYAIEATLATAPSLVLTYSFRFSLNSDIYLYELDYFTLFLTLYGISFEKENFDFYYFASYLVYVKAVLVYYGISACIFSSYYLLNLFYYLTFLYLFLTCASSSGNVSFHADFIKPKNLFYYFFFYENKKEFCLKNTFLVVFFAELDFKFFNRKCVNFINLYINNLWTRICLN